MWSYIFDFQQRLIVQDKLNANELCLLFYFSKSIIDEEFLLKKEPSLFKGFTYQEILSDLPILNIEIKQLKNLIHNLYNKGYITAEKLFGKISVALTLKMLNSLSKRQSEDEGNRKYLFLLKWKNISNSNSELGKKFPSFDAYYIFNIKNKFNINKINNLNTEEDITIISKFNNEKQKLFLLLFKKFPKFRTDNLADLNLPTNFNCNLLVKAIEQSSFLQQKVGIKFLITNYEKVIRGDYAGGVLVEDKKQCGVQKEMAFRTRTYTKEELNSLFDNIDDIKISGGA